MTSNNSSERLVNNVTTRRSGRWKLVALVSLLTVGCSGNSAATFANTNETAAPAAVESAPVAAAAPQNSYADTVARVTPAVVTVNSTRSARAADNIPPQLREFFGDRFGDQQPRRQSGVGSGVIVSRDGHILTNNHVVEDAERIRVTLSDNREFDAKVMGRDAPSDLAVLKIEANNLPILPLGDSERVRIGDVVLAVGNPLGIGQTVTSGIISAKGRSTGGAFEEFLQTDAPINRGNSGGALVNTEGQLIGINSQILSPSGGSIGIGFAVPINLAKSVMNQLLTTGKVRRSILGVRPQPITSDIASSLNLSQVRGVLVNEVTPGSAADRAGVRVGDVILKLNGEQLTDDDNFRNRIANTPPGTEVTLTLSRDGREQEVRARLEERTDEVATTNSGERGNSNRPTPTGALGIGVTPLTGAQAAGRLPQGATGGLLVNAVDPAGPAADAGIVEGDVILSVNRQPVRAVEDLTASVGRANNRPLLLLINRRLPNSEEGTSLFVTVTPRAGNQSR